jgi:hypothetical protein
MHSIYVHGVSNNVVRLSIGCHRVEVVRPKVSLTCYFLSDTTHNWLFVDRSHLVTVAMKVCREVGWCDSYSMNRRSILDRCVSFVISAYSDRATIVGEHTIFNFALLHFLFL